MLNLIRIGAGPFAILFAWWFIAEVVPQLSHDMQSAIIDGGLGMMLGIFGGSVVLSACVVSWAALTELLPRLGQAK